MKYDLLINYLYSYFLSYYFLNQNFFSLKKEYFENLFQSLLSFLILLVLFIKVSFTEGFIEIQNFLFIKFFKFPVGGNDVAGDILAGDKVKPLCNLFLFLVIFKLFILVV